MKCKNHPAVDSIAECANCGNPLCGFCSNFIDSKVFCEQCAEISAQAEFVASKSKPADELGNILAEKQSVAEQPKKQKIEESIEKSEKLLMAVVILSCLFIGARFFTTIGNPYVLSEEEVFAEVLSIQQQNLCVQVFWEIASILQNDELPDSSLKCAEASEPNIITRSGDDIVVNHPSPQLLGFSQIYVSKNNPTPTLIPLTL